MDAANDLRHGVSTMRSSVAVTIVGCALLMADAAVAQNVEFRGRVVDGQLGGPIANAVVRVPAAGRYTLTDSAGEFRIGGIAVGRQRVVVVQLGYDEGTFDVDVQADGFHTLELVPRPLRLDAVVAADERQVWRTLDGAAYARALGTAGTRGPPVFWRSWGPEHIAAAAIDEPLRFLSRGPPKVGIRPCAWLELHEDRLCVSVPFGGSDPYGYGNNRRYMPRLTARLTRPLGVQPSSARPAPQTNRTVAVYVDDRLIGGLESVAAFSMSDMVRVETYGAAGESGIRFYTEGYLRLVALGLIQPDTRVPFAETYEGRRRAGR
jgi:hypothetical protein